jgi:AcrR family transcriptional regulator
MTKQMNENPFRGPSDHSVRDQVVEAATEHFGHFGYEKTTVSDLAKAIGFSKAYIYKFFDSKQAIGEVICANRLAIIRDIVNAAIADAPTAAEKIRRLFRALSESGSDLFFCDRKLYDIAAVCVTNGRQRKLMSSTCGSSLSRSLLKAPGGRIREKNAPGRGGRCHFYGHAALYQPGYNCNII